MSIDSILYSGWIGLDGWIVLFLSHIRILFEADDTRSDRSVGTVRMTIKARNEWCCVCVIIVMVCVARIICLEFIIYTSIHSQNFDVVVTKVS